MGAAGKRATAANADHAIRMTIDSSSRAGTTSMKRRRARCVGACCARVGACIYARGKESSRSWDEAARRGYVPQMPKSKLRIGIDLGGTKIEAVALGANGKELVRQRVPTPAGYQASLDAITKLV